MQRGLGNDLDVSVDVDPALSIFISWSVSLLTQQSSPEGLTPAANSQHARRGLLWLKIVAYWF